LNYPVEVIVCLYTIYQQKILAMLLEKNMFSNILYYHTNCEKLKHNYSNRYLLIKDEKVIGHFDTWSEAGQHGLRLFKNDNFFIKYCS
jgi:hypothetical protein